MTETKVCKGLERAVMKRKYWNKRFKMVDGNQGKMVLLETFRQKGYTRRKKANQDYFV